MDATHSKVITGRHFLKLLLHLRSVLLQDAVFLLETHPNNPIFRHPIFHSPEFVHFSSRLREAATTSIDPTTAAFQYVAPEVANAIRSTTNALEGRLNIIDTTMNNVATAVQQGFNRNQENFEAFLLGQVCI